MRGKKTAIKSCLNFAIDCTRSPFIWGSHWAVSLDAFWAFSLIILTTQTIASFLKWMLLLLSICKTLCEHLCKSQHTTRQIIGDRMKSLPFRPLSTKGLCMEISFVLVPLDAVGFMHHCLATNSNHYGFVFSFSSSFFFKEPNAWFYQENGIRIVWDFVSHYQKYCSGWINPFKVAALSVSRLVSAVKIGLGLQFCSTPFSVSWMKEIILVLLAAPRYFLLGPKWNWVIFLMLWETGCFSRLCPCDRIL